MPQAVLFDFDGTLVDSAPDLVGAVNDLRVERGLRPLDYTQLRPYATYGARSLLHAGLGCHPADAEYGALRERFLSIYEQRKLRHSQLFAGVEPTLLKLHAAGIAWGVVTNKLSRFALPMIDALLRSLHLHPAIVVCGDSTPTPKPHPAPLLTAAENLRCSAGDCWFVGDGENDIRAAQAAGMISVLAGYGYIPDRAQALAWNACLTIESPPDLLGLLNA